MEASDEAGAYASEFDRDVRAALARLGQHRVNIGPPDKEPGVFAWTDLVDLEEHGVLLTLGARFVAGALRADEVHNQLLFFSPTPTSLAIQSNGTPEQLVSELDQWLSGIASRDAFRDEWIHRGQVYASTDRLDGYGDVSMRFIQSLAPRGLEKRLLKQGSFPGKGWVKPRGIGAPSRSIKLDLACESQG